MTTASKPKRCPRCETPVQGEETICSKCGYDLTSKPSEEPAKEIELAITKKWWYKAKEYGKWGTLGFIPGIILVLVPLYLGKMIELLPILVLGIILLFVAGVFYALSVYVEDKIEKGEKPFG
jgi:hypothetical protein